MSYTLWRNGRLLGELVREFQAKSPSFTMGFLAPTPDFIDVGVLHQHWIPEWPSGPVVQLRLPLPAPIESAADDDAPWQCCVPRQPLSKNAGVVPPEDVLVIRDTAGDVVLTQTIMVNRVAGFDDTVVAAYRARGQVASCWSLGFVRRGATEASFSAQLICGR
jgi:hypothetical protein